MGPSAFRISGRGEQLASLGYAVSDKGDLPAPIPETQTPRDSQRKYAREIAKVCTKLYQTALESLVEGAMPVVLGGDHSLGAGSVAAAAEWAKRTRDLPIGVLWVDAHGDMNTPSTSPSGNVHGMPLAALVGTEPSELAQIGGWSRSCGRRTPSLIGTSTDAEKVAFTTRTSTSSR
jgi:arginase